MSTPSDRDLLKMAAARLREQADMLDDIAGDFNETSRLNEAITWVEDMYERETSHDSKGTLLEVRDKLLLLRAGK